MNRINELRHLSSGAMPDDKIEGIGIFHFKVYCQGNAVQVLSNCQNVLEAVFKENEFNWPSDEEWKNLLPKWFVDQCAKEKTEQEMEERLKWWRKLPDDERNKVEQQLEWSLNNWIAWFYPDERQWFWWDAVVENPNFLRIAVEVLAWPFPWGSLDWLLRVSGATNVEVEED